MSKQESLENRLKEIRAKRGYLLPHHGLLAVSNPGLLEAYDQTYSALTLQQRILSRHDHEAVWLCILIAKREALATHHISKFHLAGGTDQVFGELLALTAFLEGVTAYDFVGQQWQSHVPGIDPAKAYTSAFESNCRSLDGRLAQLCAIAVHASLGHWQALSWQIKAAYEFPVPEPEIAEALSLMMFPGSVPYFVRAAATWRQLILAGEVKASPDFQAWAEISGQGGFDEAAGVVAKS